MDTIYGIKKQFIDMFSTRKDENDNLIEHWDHAKACFYRRFDGFPTIRVLFVLLFVYYSCLAEHE